MDQHDQRILGEVRSGKCLFRGSKSGLKGLPDSQDDVGGWEKYPVVRRPGNWDTDLDGMPDHWEKRMGFDRNDPTDGPKDHDQDGFTNLEEYLESCTVD